MKLRRTLAIILSLCLGLAAMTASVAAQDIEHGRPIEDHMFGVSSVVPADWQDLGGGVYSRGTPPDDLALIAIQSAPATPDQLWPSLLPQFALTEVPRRPARYSSELLDWTIYEFDVQPGEIESSPSELATGRGGRCHHLVLLQSDPDGVRQPARAGAAAGHRGLRAAGARAHARTRPPSTTHIEEVSLPGRRRGCRAGGHADAARSGLGRTRWW